MSVDGKGSTNNLESTKKCPKCKRKGHIHYTGSNVLHGNPYTSAANTEVEHYYQCEKCGHEFSEFA